MSRRHVHKYILGRSGDIRICQCGRFEYTEQGLAKNPPIIEQPVQAERTGEIQLTPDFDFLFAQFTREAKIQAEAHAQDAHGLVATEAMLAVVGPLNVAIQSMTKLSQIAELREVTNAMVEIINKRQARLDAEEDTPK